jgi:hypothetical protein
MLKDVIAENDQYGYCILYDKLVMPWPPYTTKLGMRSGIGFLACTMVINGPEKNCWFQKLY